MTNNDILRRLRYTFDLNDSKMISIFGQSGLTVTREEVSDWLKKDDDPAYVEITDSQFASFLNGFINEKRGKKDGPQPEPEQKLTRNLIFLKLKIALNQKAEDVIEILNLVEFKISNHELSALFRKPGHKHYRECKDQLLRNYIHGLQLKYRPQAPSEDEPAAPEPSAEKPAAED